jgi:predicted transcriptional regulator
MKDTLTIRLDSPLRRELEQLSKEERIPLSDLVRESLRKYVMVRRFRQLRKKLLPLAEAQGFLTDDDVFRRLK